MQLETTRFGTLEVKEGEVITFTQPIIGFQDYRRFVLLPIPGDGVRWLQSTESSELAFILMDPRQVMADYKVEVGQRELAELAATSLDDLEVYTLLVVPEDRTQIRTNLRAPILINAAQGLGKQTILERSHYPIQFFLAREQGSSEQDQEVANARSDT